MEYYPAIPIFGPATEIELWPMLVAMFFYFVVLYVYFRPLPETGDKRPKEADGSVPGLQPSHPEKGNFPDIEDAGSLQKFLEHLHASFGGIASFWWNKTKVVSIAKPDLFKEHNLFFDRPLILFAMLEPLATKHSIQFANGDDGKLRRKIYDRPFAHEAMNRYCTRLNKTGKALVKKWLDVPVGEHIALGPAMENVALRAISCALFGVHFEDDKNVDQLAAIYHKLWDEIVQVVHHGKDVQEAFGEAFHADKEHLVVLLKEACEARIKNPVPESEKAFIDVILESGQSDDVIKADCISFLVGGFHLPAYMLTWAMYFLADNEAVQEKLCSEIKDVVKGNDVTSEEISKMIYTQQVLDETMRCSALVTYAARYSDKETKLGGYNIPAGTPVMHSLGVALLDPEIWQNPQRFDPDRFSPEKVDKRSNYDFVPFGFAGKRKCPGYRFTYYEGAILLAQIVKTFKVKAVEGQNVEPVYGLVTHPKNEIWITLEKRN